MLFLPRSNNSISQSAGHHSTPFTIRVVVVVDVLVLVVLLTRRRRRRRLLGTSLRLDDRAQRWEIIIILSIRFRCSFCRGDDK